MDILDEKIPQGKAEVILGLSKNSVKIPIEKPIHKGSGVKRPTLSFLFPILLNP
jgi:hypothetical protein